MTGAANPVRGENDSQVIRLDASVSVSVNAITEVFYINYLPVVKK